MLRNLANLPELRRPSFLNEVLSLNAQESTRFEPVGVNYHFLNEVLSLNAQEFLATTWPAWLKGMFLNEVLSLNAQE